MEWSVIAHDNSEVPVMISGQLDSGITLPDSPYNFPIGETVTTVVASDASSNTDTCSFTVTIVGMYVL